MYFTASGKDQRPDPPGADQRDWPKLLSIHKSFTSYIHLRREAMDGGFH